ncbi:MAG: NTP transferase domain-containing protein [Nanoarchaeota archaeon]|nr:NTP transferase domain-containing protein [Nanoarchaeota archaeon]
MQVVILCGGKGTRMWPLTKTRPKPMIPIGEKPLLWHLMKIYSYYGHKEFLLCLGHMANIIKDYFSNPENIEKDWKISFIDTGLDFSKSERIMKVRDHIKEDNFLLAYGDDIAQININESIEFHIQNNKMVTLTAPPLFSQFGVLEINQNNEITYFREKPRLENFWFNGGFFVFNRKIFDYLHLGELEKEVFENLSQERQISAFKLNGYWQCMNTSKEAMELNQLWEKGNAPWKVWKN